MHTQIKSKVRELISKKARKSSIESIKLSEALQIVEPIKSSSKQLALQANLNKSLNASIHSRRASQINFDTNKLIMASEVQSITD